MIIDDAHGEVLSGPADDPLLKIPPDVLLYVESLAGIEAAEADRLVRGKPGGHELDDATRLL